MSTADYTYGFSEPKAREISSGLGARSNDRFVGQVPGQVFLEYFWPPSGGIPAATNTTTGLTPGVAICYRATQSSVRSYGVGSLVATVENPVSAIVGLSGKAIGCIRNAYGTYTVIVEDCASSESVAPGTVVNDPVSGGTSRGIDFGYTVNV